jgi:hypothetical protein
MNPAPTAVETNREYIHEADMLPYRIVALPNDETKRLEFLTPADERFVTDCYFSMIVLFYSTNNSSARRMLTSRDVLACGSCFQIQYDGEVSIVK